jgi:hypothetical protein
MRLPIPDTEETSLTVRLPNDLRDTAANLDFFAWVEVGEVLDRPGHPA